MAGSLHQHQPAAGVAGPGEHHQLLLNRGGDQIKAASHQQHRHIEILQAPVGPEQAAETIESHHPQQRGWLGNLS